MKELYSSSSSNVAENAARAGYCNDVRCAIRRREGVLSERFRAAA